MYAQRQLDVDSDQFLKLNITWKVFRALQLVVLAMFTSLDRPHTSYIIKHFYKKNKLYVYEIDQEIEICICPIQLFN